MKEFELNGFKTCGSVRSHVDCPVPVRRGSVTLKYWSIGYQSNGEYVSCYECDSPNNVSMLIDLFKQKYSQFQPVVLLVSHKCQRI